MPRRKRSPTTSLIRAFFPPPRRTRKKVSRTKTATAKRPARAAVPLAKASGAAKTTRSPLGAGTWRSCRYAGTAGTRRYYLYIPPGLGKSTPVPLLVALHGCGQDAGEFAASTRFNLLADAHQFVIAYPEQPMTHNAQRCWNWFRPAHQQRGSGEPAILAGIVARILQQPEKWQIDADRVYVMGLSAGGGMSAVLAATYPDVFAACGIHSAPPYRAAATAINAARAMTGFGRPPPAPDPAAQAMPPLVIFHGTGDHIVSSVNAHRLVEQWLAHYSVDASRSPSDPPLRTRTAASRPASPRTKTSRRGYQVQRWYGAGGRKMLELWIVDGLGHAWSGGVSEASYSDPRGPRASTEMWKFLSAQHR